MQTGAADGISAQKRHFPWLGPIRRLTRPGQRMNLARLLAWALGFVLPCAFAFEGPYCGKEGVWVQILGAGGPELDDGGAGPSYLLWLDNHARLLLDAGPGASARFDQAGAHLADLQAIALTQLSVHHSADLPAFLEGALRQDRSGRLPVLGPEGWDGALGLTTFLERLIGADGAYPKLADLLKIRPDSGLRIVAAPTLGRRRWAGFSSEHLRLAAAPVHHGGAPALAWRVEAAGQSVVFAGDFSNQRDLIADFAKDADALVVSHAIPEGARGEARELYATPSQIGRIAARAGVGMVILSHRSNRTRGRESQSRAALEAHYKGALIFANDLECWGL